MKNIAMIAVLLPVLAACASTPQQSEVQQIQGAYNAWINTNNKGTAEQVSSLYHDKAIVSCACTGKVSKTPAERLSFLKDLKKMGKATITSKEENIRLLDEDTAVNSGKLEISHGKKGKIKTPVQYSFVYEKVNGKWLIIDQLACPSKKWK